MRAKRSPLGQIVETRKVGVAFSPHPNVATSVCCTRVSEQPQMETVE